jgi:osmotically-inducible protein OsmY
MSFAKKRFLSLVLAVGFLGMSVPVLGQTDEELKLTEDVRKRIARLSQYRAFDWISFTVEGTKVTLMGYASRPSLHKSAEKTVSKIKGVTEVDNQIEKLPTSNMDDEIRTRTYMAIYTHPSLQRYAPGGGMTQSTFMHEARTISHWGLDASMNMRGPHPIHIIVNRGHVALVGFVSSKMDRQIAETQVRSVPDVFSIQNLIQTND